MTRRLALCLLVPCALLSLAWLPDAQSFRERRDYDLAPLGESLRAYLEARTSTVGLDEAKAELVKTLDELRVEIGGGHPLARSIDVGHALWLSHAYAKQKVRGGKVDSDRLEVGSFRGDGLSYAYRVPRDYDPAERAYPLILAISDWDEKPEEHLRTHWSSSTIRDQAIVVCPEMPATREDWDRVMVNGRPGGLCHVLTALRIAGERFAVDFDRVYVAGRGKGVPAAVAAGNHCPHRFAGVIGRGGDVGALGPDNFENLPTWFAGAGAEATAFQKAAKEAGIDNCELHPTGGEEDVWPWILDHPRRTWPDRVTVVTGKPFPTRVGWLRIAPCAPDARAVAEIDREANSIRIDGEGISNATLYLNDELVDLDRPVTVVCNGVEQDASISRQLANTLDLIHDGTSDPASVYTAVAMFAASGEEAAASARGIPAPDPDYQRRLAEAGGAVEDLWALYEWCRSNDREEKAAAVLRRLLQTDPEHAAAREALGHRRFLDRWFTSDATLERFRRRQDEKAALARGHVKHKGIWMHPDERRLVNKGRVKDHETGQWLTVAERRRLAEGWVRQDLEWIPPEDAGRVDEGRWLVDGEWLDLAQANLRHARIDSMWRIPGPDVLLYSAADREVSLRAMAEMGRAIEDLNRVFGAEPMLPLPVAVLRDEEQYDQFAFGDPDGRRPATHTGRLQLIHSAFFSESWFPLVDGKREYRGMGACYWDALAPNGDLYGVHAARLAVGLSYVDALDPSPKAVRKAVSGGMEPDYYAAFREEKVLPAWLRYGGPVYAERYFHDERVAAGQDPWWPRKWSLDNLERLGGLRPLREVFEGRLDPDDREGGMRLLLEAGLVVAFVVDGECAPVVEAHTKLKRALASGKVGAGHVGGLTKALLEHEAELRTFAGVE